jgi:hypothetical protein
MLKGVCEKSQWARNVPYSFVLCERPCVETVVAVVIVFGFLVLVVLR